MPVVSLERTDVGWREALRLALNVEATRLVVWCPLALVAGIWIYFGLAREPAALLVWLIAVVSAALCWRRRMLVVAFVGIGFALATLHVGLKATPLLRGAERNVEVVGVIADLERRGKRSHILIVDVLEASTLPETEQPRRLRLRTTGLPSDAEIGDQFRMQADLRPLPRPLRPGGFDYGRQLFFEDIGASGRVLSLQREVHEVSWHYQLRRQFQALRAAIGRRIRDVIPGDIGAFAEAIINGERADISQDMNESLRQSGLFHVLSISGLHMSLVAGGAFWLVRALLALSPMLALNYPIKKWSAIAALVSGLFYMLLADGGAATTRSYVMIAIVFFAILVDRPALSMRNLAIAAIIILAMSPEQAVMASFQMSFLAVMGLAAFYEWWSRSKDVEVKDTPPRWLVLTKNGARLATASILASLVAGGLSSIAAVHHFGTVAPYAVVSNALALPLIGFAVMPLAVFATLAMPLGLEYWPLQALALSLRGVMAISDYVSDLPGAGLTVPLWSAAASAGVAFAAAIFCLCVTRLRWLAVLPLVVAFYLLNTSLADVIVDEQGRNVAVRGDDGRLQVFHAKQARFAVTQWLRDEGDQRTLKDAAQGWNCTEGVCLAKVKGKSIAVLLRSAEPVKPCPNADILIAQYPLRRSCKGRFATIDRFHLWLQGAHQLRIESATVDIETARAGQGLRPWSYEPRPRRPLKPK